MWLSFLTEKGGRAVSKDSWNLVRSLFFFLRERRLILQRLVTWQFLDFTRTIDPAFKQYDEDGT